MSQKRERITARDRDVRERDTAGKSETSQQWLNSSSAVPTFDVYQSPFPHPPRTHQNQILKKNLRVTKREWPSRDHPHSNSKGQCPNELYSLSMQALKQILEMCCVS